MDAKPQIGEQVAVPNGPRVNIMDRERLVFCDECKNFPDPSHHTWGGPKNGKYQCMAFQPMTFLTPRSPIDELWGFVRKKCRHACKRTGPNSPSLRQAE